MLRRTTLSGIQRFFSILVIVSLLAGMLPAGTAVGEAKVQALPSPQGDGPASPQGTTARISKTPLSIATPGIISENVCRLASPLASTGVVTPDIGGYSGYAAGTTGVIGRESSPGTWTKPHSGTLGQNVSQLVRSYDGAAYYAVMGNNGGLYKSTDDGETWTLIFGNYDDYTRRVVDIAVAGDVVFAAVTTDAIKQGYSGDITAYSGIYMSTDGGSSWERLFTPMPDNPNPLYAWRATSVGVSPEDGNFIWMTGERRYANSSDRVFLSRDGGQTWSKVYETANGERIQQVIPDPASVDTAYMVKGSLTQQYNGLFKSDNGGETWPQIYSSLDVITGDWVWSDKQRLVISPTDNHELAFAPGTNASEGKGVAISADGGTSWTQVTVLSSSAADERICTIARASDGTLWAGADTFRYIDGGQSALTSTDGGVTWNDMTGDMASGTSELHDDYGPMRVKSIMSEGLPPDPEARYNWPASFNSDAALYGCPECTTSMYAEPVNTSTGNFFYEYQDLSVPGQGGQTMFIERGYNSKDAATPSPLGYGWTFNYNNSLTRFRDDTVALRDAQGRQFLYTPNGDGTYTSSPGDESVLTKNEDGTFLVRLVSQTTINFDSSGKLTSIVDQNGNTQTLSYSDGRLTAVTDASGRSLDFDYSAEGYISQITDPLDNTVQYGYTDGDLTSVTDLNGRTTDLIYDGNHHLLTITDANNHTQVDNTYDGEARVVSQKDANLNQTSFSYDEINSRTTITDVRGGVSTYDFDNKSRTTSETNQLGGTQTYTYDGDNNRTSVTDRNGNTTNMAYDDTGNLVGVNDPSGNSRNFTYDSNHNVTGEWWTLTNSQNLLTNDNFEDWTGSSLDNWTVSGSPGLTKETSTPNLRFGLASAKLSSATAVEGVIKQTVDVSPSTTYVVSYYVKSQGLSGTGPHGKVVVAEVDSSGVVVADRTGVFDNISGDNDWSRKSASFTTGSTTVKVTIKAVLGYNAPASGTVWFDGIMMEPGSTKSDYSDSQSYDYDDNGNLTSTTNALGKATIFDYDGHGNLLSVTDPLSRTTSFGYDDYGYPTSITDPAGKVQTQEWDAVGRLLSATDPLSHTTSFTYDNEGRPLSSTDALGHSSYVEYDNIGNRTVVTDTNGNATHYAYDAKDNLETVTDSLGNVTTYDYDEHDNLISVTDANNHTTSYDYDLADRLTTATDPLDNVTSYDYDAVGNTKVITDANGAVTHFDYDGNSQLTKITYPDTTVQYTYDSLGNPTKMTDQYGNTKYAYDALSQLLSVTRPGGLKVQYTYDDAGQRTSMTYPNTSDTVEYEYDSRGLLTRLSDWASRVMTYTWDDAGRLSGFHYPNNTDTSYTYDDANRVTNITATGPGGATINSFSYEYDNMGDPLVMTDTEGTTTYSYDDLYRLTEAGYPDSTYEEFQYDPVGNRTVLTSTSGTTAYTYDDANRLESAGGTTYTWDDNGNLKTKTVGANTFSYSYDDANQLTEVTGGGGGTHTYQYWGDGLRKKATDRGVVTNYTWDVALPVPVVITDTTNAYRYGVDLAWAGGAGVTSYYHSDGLGSIRNLSNASGSKIDSYSYYAFGGIRTSSGSRENPFRFAGEQLDDTGLVYLRARYYDPSTGRFMSKDPLSGTMTDPQSQNPFAYCQNRPTTMVDPSGMGSGFWDPQAKLSWVGLAVMVSIPLTFGLGPWGIAALLPQYFLEGTGIVGAGGAALERASEECAPVVERASTMEPNLIRYSQDSIKLTFQDGRSLADTINGLKSGAIKAADLPPIRVFMRDGKLYTLDNRRLYAFQQAGVKIKYVWATAKEVAEEAWKFHPIDDGLSIKIRGVR